MFTIPVGHYSKTSTQPKGILQLPELNDIRVRATTYNSNIQFSPFYVFDVNTSLINEHFNNSWSSVLHVFHNQKILVDFGNKFILKKVRYNNFHFYGDVTDRGVKNVELYGSNISGVMGIGNFFDITALNLIWRGEFNRHTAGNAPQLFDIDLKDNEDEYQYYVLRFFDTYGSNIVMQMRRIMFYN